MGPDVRAEPDRISTNCSEAEVQDSGFGLGRKAFSAWGRRPQTPGI